MANLSDFLPVAGGGGGGIPKYQEFTTSGTFTPSQAHIDAGGRVSYIMVGGGANGNDSGQNGGPGGGVRWGFQTLTSTTGCTVTIGSGGTGDGGAGGNTSVAFNSAGGTAITALGGALNSSSNGYGGGNVSWGGGYTSYNNHSAFSGVMGLGIGGGDFTGGGLINPGVANSGAYGAGAYYNNGGNPGYVLITWFE